MAVTTAWNAVHINYGHILFWWWLSYDQVSLKGGTASEHSPDVVHTIDSLDLFQYTFPIYCMSNFQLFSFKTFAIHEKYQRVQ